jgi:hypothetical protein
MGEQGALAQHALVSSGELDFGDSKGMAEMEASVHVRVGIVAEPFGVFLENLLPGEACELGRRWGIYFKETL